MTIQTDLQSLSPTALLTFYSLDYTNQPGGSVLNFHAGTNEMRQPIVWQGVTYVPLPIGAEGFDVTAKGAMPRPKLRVANPEGAFSATVKSFDDFVGAKVTRKRTFLKYLDAVNFAAGNATADQNQFLPDDLWFVERKLSENRQMIEFELSSAFDLMGQKLPNRQVIQNSCPWKYRGLECGWTGGFYDINNAPTTVGGDVCAKTLSACRVRFATISQPIRFGGFPGAVRGTT